MMNGVTPISAPPAIDPFYSTARPNQPIVLFRGRVDLVGMAATERHRGGIVLDWLPSPTLRSWVRGGASDLATQAVMGGDEVTVTPRTPRQTVPRQSKTTRGGPRDAEMSFETGSHLLDYECGDGAAALSHGLLHLANFPRFHGRPVRWPDGSLDPGRLLFEGGGWTIVLDPVQNGADLERELKNDGGFALTHTARAQRTSGAPFTSAELQEITDALTFFCWLCTEARCGPMLPVGFDGRGQARSARWSPTRTESFPAARTWLDTAHTGEAETLFPTFMARFGDPYWRQVLTHAIAYLVEAGRPDTIERAIIMAQVLLEAMSYSWLVEERKLRTHDEFEDRTAAENIRAMLLDMQVPVAIPKTLRWHSPRLAPRRGRRSMAPKPSCSNAMRSSTAAARHYPQPMTRSSMLGDWVPGTRSSLSFACAASTASTEAVSTTTFGRGRGPRAMAKGPWRRAGGSTVVTAAFRSRATRRCTLVLCACPIDGRWSPPGRYPGLLMRARVRDCLRITRSFRGLRFMMCYERDGGYWGDAGGEVRGDLPAS